MTSVDNTKAYGLDQNFAPTMKAMHNKVDGLISHIDILIANTKAFKDGYD